MHRKDVRAPPAGSTGTLGRIHRVVHRETVLVTAGDRELRASLAAAVSAAGFAASSAGGGMEALEQAGLHQPGLIVVALDLAEMDAWTVIKLLGESPRTEWIPVVLVSSSPTESERRKAQLLGCRDLVSADAPQVLAEAVSRVLGPARTVDPGQTPHGVIRRRYWRRPVSAA